MKTPPFAAFLLLLAGCGPDIPNLDSPGRTIVCLGDSITSGVAAEPAQRKILDRLLAARVVPVLVEIEVPFRGKYAEVFERIDDDYDIPIVEDTLGEILLDADLKADPIHPNAAGQRILAEAITEVVEPILEARRKQ